MEFLLAVLTFILFINAAVSIYLSAQGMGHLYIWSRLHERHQNNFVYSVVGAVALVVILGLIFRNSLIAKLAVGLVDAALIAIDIREYGIIKGGM